MHPTQSVTLVHDRHRGIRAAAPAAGANRTGQAVRTQPSLAAPIRAARAALASVRHLGTPRRTGRPLTTRPSDC